ncbi:MAG: ABC transporter permease [Oscillospiraceae bacterium]|jgi:peptide/nickel transport system permease protein|nr:ABC transporter permease [Oscillospiraceae bacterium]
MLKFVVRRAAMSIGLFLILTFVLFLVLQLLPTYAQGDINAYVMEYGSITAEHKLEIYAKYELDKPAAVRYFFWLGSLFDGTWSHTYANMQISVLSVIAGKIGQTLTLMSISLAAAIVIALPLGMMAAMKPGGIADSVANLLTFIGVSLPGFIVAIFLIFIFSAKLAILPSMMVVTSKYSYAAQLILPVTCVSITVIGPVVKQVRGSMLDVMNAEYIKTARSKGIPERRVIVRHVFRNSAIPVVTQIGLAMPMLVGGSVIVEQIFTINGIGRALIAAINAPADVPVIMGIVAIQVIVVLFVNLALDLIYTVLDPRVVY